MRFDSFLSLRRSHAFVASVLAVLSALIFSCDPYQPEGVFFKELQQIAPTSTITLTAFGDSDTITIYEATQFNFDIDDLNLPLIACRVTLNDQTLYNGNSASGSFSVSDSWLATATYKMKFLVTMKPGNGSLTDRDGTAAVEVWREWTLIIDRAPPPIPVLTVSKNENGFLKISWQPFNKPTFDYYQLGINKPNGPDGYKSYLFNDPTKTSYIDSTYVSGFYAAYTLTILSPLGSPSATIVLDEPQSFSVSIEPSDSTVSFAWRRSQYPGAFLQTVISENYIPIHTITDANDTTVTLKRNLLFGKDVNYGIKITGKYISPDYPAYSNIYYLNNPLQFPTTEPSSVFYYSTTLGALLGYNPNDDKIRQYDDELNVVNTIDNISNQPTIPYPGRFMYYPERGIGLSRVNLVTGEKKSIGIAQVQNYFVTPSVSGADNGYVTYSFVDYTRSWDLRYISALIDFDYPGDRLWSTDVAYSVGGYYGVPILSDDGIFAIHRNQSIYTVDSNGLTSVGFVSGILGFRPDKNDELIVRSSPNTTVIDPTTQTVIRTIQQPEQSAALQSYDPVTKCLFFTNPSANKVFLVHIETGEVTEIAAGPNLIFAGGFLFGSGGTYVKIK